VPFRPELYDLVVQFDADPAGHAHDHRLAFDHGQALLEVIHYIFGNETNALLRAYERFEGCPFRLQPFLLPLLLVLGDLFEFLVDLGLLALLELDLREAALVVYRDGGSVLDGPLDVVDADVVPEDRPRALVLEVERRACETYE